VKHSLSLAIVLLAVALAAAMLFVPVSTSEAAEGPAQTFNAHHLDEESASTLAVAQPETTEAAWAVSYSPHRVGVSGAVPLSNDSFFSADTGGSLDQYGMDSTFDIPIDRFFGGASVGQLVDIEVLPETAYLYLRMYDADTDMDPDWQCLQDYYVSVNGHQLPIVWGGATDNWRTFAIPFPTTYLELPSSQGTNGPPEPAFNEIEVDAPNHCNDPMPGVRVDWGSIAISGAVRPILFLHGHSGNPPYTDSDGDFHEGSFSWWEGFLQVTGIPSAGQADLHKGFRTIERTVVLVQADIERAKLEFGVDKVNLFAHSKGGLVARIALEEDEIASNVETLITFGAPHHGVPIADAGGFDVFEDELHEAACSGYEPEPGDPTQDECEAAARELGEDNVRDAYNYENCSYSYLSGRWSNCVPKFGRPRAEIQYVTFAGQHDSLIGHSATYPWTAAAEDEMPYPHVRRVNQVIPTDYFVGDAHSQVKDTYQSYRCALSYLNESVYSSEHCPDNDPRPQAGERRLPDGSDGVRQRAGQRHANFHCVH
jgi:hypothetical protein